MLINNLLVAEYPHSTAPLFLVQHHHTSLGQAPQVQAQAGILVLAQVLVHIVQVPVHTEVQAQAQAQVLVHTGAQVQAL